MKEIEKCSIQFFSEGWDEKSGGEENSRGGRGRERERGKGRKDRESFESFLLL